MDRRTALKVLSLSAASAAAVGGKLLMKRPREIADPPAVALNQAGYLPTIRKVATVPAQQADRPFVLRDESTTQTVFQGVAGLAVHDLCSGDDGRLL